MQAQLSVHSQTSRLRERMEQAEVKHGEEIRVDLTGVRVMAGGREWLSPRREKRGDVFFCSMGPVRLRKVAICGDGGPLPSTVTLEGLEVPDEGIYDLLNVLVRSNGRLQLIVDEATGVTAAVRARESSLVGV
jgi:hypothetical protein